MRYYIDTNIVLRFLIADNPRIHRDCVRLFQAIEQSDLTVYLPSICLAEIVWTLKSFYEFPRNQITDVVARIVQSQNIIVQDQTDYALVLEILEATSAKYTDVCIASQSGLQTKTAQLISYDTDFDKLGIKRIEPDQLFTK